MEQENLFTQISFFLLFTIIFTLKFNTIHYFAFYYCNGSCPYVTVNDRIGH